MKKTKDNPVTGKTTTKQAQQLLFEQIKSLGCQNKKYIIKQKRL